MISAQYFCGDSYLSGVFNDHFAGIYVTQTEQPSSMNIGTKYADSLLGCFFEVAEPHSHRQVETCYSPAHEITKIPKLYVKSARY